MLGRKRRAIAHFDAAGPAMASLNCFSYIHRRALARVGACWREPARAELLRLKTVLAKVSFVSFQTATTLLLSACSRRTSRETNGEKSTESNVSNKVITWKRHFTRRRYYRCARDVTVSIPLIFFTASTGNTGIPPQH